LSPPSTSRSRLLFFAVFVVSALYMARELKSGWVPSDEGTFGQSAERVLQGELPHRDFDEGYTGGETYLNALIFRILGIKLVNLRYTLYLFFLLWVPAIYYVASRLVSPPVSAAVTLLAVAWGPPNYTAPMPSWYNLFFATWGIAAILRYLEGHGRSWLFLAGICGGASFTFKQSGLYFIAGVLLFLVFRERLSTAAPSRPGNEDLLFRSFVVASIVLYEIVVFRLLRNTAYPIVLLYFLVPNLAIGFLLIWCEFSSASRRNRRFAFLSRESLPFLAGVILPIIIFLAPNIATGSLKQFEHDAFQLIGRRFVYATLPPIRGHSILTALANLLLIPLPFMVEARVQKAIGVLALVGTPGILWMALYKSAIYRAIWHTIWLALPTMIVIGACLMMRRFRSEAAAKPAQLQKVFLLLSVTATCCLIQFPFTAPIYLCYVAPLAILSAAGLISLIPRPPRLMLAGAFCLLFSYVVFEVTPGFVYNMGVQYSADRRTDKLTLPRVGGLRVFPQSAATYERLRTVLAAHANGEFIYATPDCPEVYFLYGFRNPTRTFFDFSDEPAGRTERIVSAIREHAIQLVVLNSNPQYSPSVPADLRQALESGFQNRETVGSFEVRWKSSTFAAVQF
jgi:hypothetical protein